MNLKLSAVASVPLEISEGAQRPQFDLLYTCHWAALHVFPSRKSLSALTVYHLGGLNCCLFARCALSWRVARLPGLRGDLGGFARELQGAIFN